MFLSRRKKTYCQNCQYPLTSNYNFCPECGQENTDKLVSFNTLIGDFFVNYFSYDSRLARTVVPFLFKPGHLSKEFIAGRRTKYMHPLRLYLIISFFYFLAFSVYVNKEVEDEKLLNFKTTNIEEPVINGEPVNIDKPDNSVKEANQLISENTIVQNNDSITGEENYKEGDFFEKLRVLQKEGVTPEEVLQTLDTEYSPLKYAIAKQGIKFANERSETVFSYLIKSASIMMFLLLPFFALLLKLFYIRRKKLYVEHITFTLHIHSFLFFILLLAILIYFIWPYEDILTFSIFIILIYFFIAFKNFYRQSWIKTAVKMFLLFIIYQISFFIFLWSTMTISFFLY